MEGLEVGTEVAECDRPCPNFLPGRGTSGIPGESMGGSTSSLNDKVPKCGLLAVLDPSDADPVALCSLFVRPPQFRRME
jgi:hypothetical protein